MTRPVTWTPTAAEALRRISGRLFATSTEAGAILGVDPRTLRAAIERGEIPATRVGVAWRVPVSWLRAQVHVASPEPG